jgi:hypothetical protein
MRSRLSTATASIRLIAVSLAAAAAIFGGLAVQMAHGHDPALGAGTKTAQSSGSSDQSYQSGDSSAGGVVTRAS